MSATVAQEIDRHQLLGTWQLNYIITESNLVNATSTDSIKLDSLQITTFNFGDEHFTKTEIILNNPNHKFYQYVDTFARDDSWEVSFDGPMTSETNTLSMGKGKNKQEFEIIRATTDELILKDFHQLQLVYGTIFYYYVFEKIDIHLNSLDIDVFEQHPWKMDTIYESDFTGEDTLIIYSDLSDTTMGEQLTLFFIKKYDHKNQLSIGWQSKNKYHGIFGAYSPIWYETSYLNQTITFYRGDPNVRPPKAFPYRFEVMDENHIRLISL
ncbi:MAG: hypothetical protein ACI8Q1_002192 [Parvicella sp.]|jgi:hypothetical protein